jgi:hypothetical protein
VVGADRADHLHVLCAGHTRDLGTECLRDLDGERSDAAGRPVDQDLLSRLDCPIVAQELEAVDAETPIAAACSNVRSPASDELVLACVSELGERTRAPAEHVVAGRNRVTSFPTASTVRRIGPGTRFFGFRIPVANHHEQVRRMIQSPTWMEAARTRTRTISAIWGTSMSRNAGPRRAVSVLNDRVHHVSPYCTL